MRIEYFEPVDSPVLFALLKIEVCLMLINVFIYCVIFYIILRTPFHRNLQILFLLVVFYYNLSMAARGVTIAAILGLLPVDPKKPEDNLLVLAASFIRMFFFAAVSFAASSFYFERRVATIFLEDYEIKQRLYFSFLIGLWMTAGSLLAAYLVVYDRLHWILLIFVTVVQSMWFVFRFWCLEKFNNKTMKNLNKGRVQGRYSLSIRYQLVENLRVMKLMKYTFVMMIAVNLFSCGVYFSANFESIRRGDPVVWQLLDTVFNIIVNIDGYLVPLTVLAADDSYKKILKEIKFLSWIVFWYHPPPDVLPPDEEAAIYFSTLQMQWENMGQRGNTPSPRKILANFLRRKREEKKKSRETQVIAKK